MAIPTTMDETDKEFARHCDFRLALFTQRVARSEFLDEELLEPPSRSRVVYDPLPRRDSNLMFGIDV